jgi:hypothetical protein
MAFAADQAASALVYLGDLIVRAEPERYDELLRITGEQDSPELRKAAAALRARLAGAFAAPVVDRRDKWRRLRRVADELKGDADADLAVAGSGLSNALLALGY